MATHIDHSPDLCRSDVLVHRLSTACNEVLQAWIAVPCQRRRFLDWPWKPHEANVIVALVPICGQYSGFITLWVPRRTSLACLHRLRPDLEGSTEVCEEVVCDLVTLISGRLRQQGAAGEVVERAPRLATNLPRIPFPEGSQPVILQMASAVGPFFIGAGFVHFDGTPAPSILDEQAKDILRYF